MSKEISDKPRRRGIYLLPNLFTTAALFGGFYAIIASMNGRFADASVAIFVAMVLDGLDGRVARMTNTESAFGAEYDSLSDMVSFGLAPALVVYQWSLQGLGKLGWLAAFFYAAATALRLARFNTQIGSADKRYFQGLPCPAAAGAVAGLVWVASDRAMQGADLSAVGLAMTVFAGALMVSNVRFYSFKDLNLGDRVPFVNLLVVLLIFLLISTDPPLILFLTFVLYAASGPLITLAHIRQRRRSRKQGIDDDDDDAEVLIESQNNDDNDKDHKS